MHKAQTPLLFRAFAAATVVVLVTWFGLVELHQPSAPAEQDLSIVVRTPTHLEDPIEIRRLVDNFVNRGVKRVWVQLKQDETDEYVAGSVFYPSNIAPVAPGYEDNRLHRFIRALAANNIEPLGWMPVLHDRRAGEMNPQWRSQWIAEDGSIEIEEEWLCPYYPGVAAYQASLAQEILTRFPELKGLYLDFIRYDDDFACACPDCLSELAERTDWQTHMGRALEPMDVRRAAKASDETWRAWIAMRAEKIVTVIDTIRDATEEVRPDVHLGAFVLPFSSTHYEFNTQAGQDLYRMARSGLDEIVLMGYWDDWDLSPWWVHEGLDAAGKLVNGEAELSVVLDGDMGVRRTRLTLQALDHWAPDAGWFHYGTWSAQEFKRLRSAIDGYKQEGPLTNPEQVSVTIRIDTEPDYQRSYSNTHPGMIDSLLRLFAEEDVKATFVTVAKLAEMQTDVLHKAAAQGHEIASHAYDHEQLDDLAPEQQIAVVDSGLTTLNELGFKVYGFGAPRNSVTDTVRDRLMAWNLEYDGSAAYDPLQSLLDVQYVTHTGGEDARILVIPFIMPNDWDARYVAEMSADEMLDAWKARLDRVIEIGEPVFVLDIHQWSASQPDNLAALRSFIRHVKDCQNCRIVTLREAARHARSVLDRYEILAPTSGNIKPTLGQAPGAPH